MFKKVFAIVLAIACVLALTACGEQPEEPMPQEEIPVNAMEDSQTRKTLIYLEDANGCVAPVMQRIEWSETMQYEALTKLASESVTAMLGYELNPTFAPGAQLGLDIKDGRATVTTTAKALDAENKTSEKNKVISVVNTLTGFENINEVAFVIDGEESAKLKNGTVVEGVYTAFDLNPSGEGENSALVYFESEGGHIVPVTVYSDEKPDVAMAVEALLDGVDKDGLTALFPEETRLVSYDVDDSDVLTLNFSGEFMELAGSEAEDAAIKTLYLTCFEFDNIEDVAILVDGEEYSSEAAAMAVTYPNTY